MNLYREMRESQQKRADDFLHQYAFFAFSDKQFKEGLQKFNIEEGTEPERLTRIIGGGFVLKERVPEFRELMDAFSKEKSDAMDDPETGEQFIYDMFYEELSNHEYIVSGDVWETLESLNMTFDEVRARPELKEALEKACKDILNEE